MVLFGKCPSPRKGFSLQNNFIMGGIMKKLLTVAALLYWCGWYYPYWGYDDCPIYWGCWR